MIGLTARGLDRFSLFPEEPATEPIAMPLGAKTHKWDGKLYAELTPCCQMPLFMERICCFGSGRSHREGICSGCGAHLDSRAVWTVPVWVIDAGDPKPERNT